MMRRYTTKKSGEKVKRMKPFDVWRANIRHPPVGKGNKRKKVSEREETVSITAPWLSLIKGIIHQ